ILLRTGSRGRDVLELASEILKEFGNARGLSRATEEEMMAISGLGESKICVLMAALELGKRAYSGKKEPEEGLPWEKRLSTLAVELAGEEREYIVALYVRKDGTLITDDVISYGGPDGAFLDVKYFLRRAVRLDCSGLVLVHNHPDGSLRPSREDRMLTDYLAGRTKMLDIRFIGHYVAANGEYASIQLPPGLESGD
ncbi:MAG: DNA repair protein RadC, partial [Synergistaceae bacterium]|nr:DNA repair protein RadC [Synergistaceae bacterium]